MILFNTGEPTNPHPDNTPHQVLIVRRNWDLGLVHCHLGRGHTVLDEEVHLLDLFLLDKIGRCEVGDLASDPRGKV